MTEYIDIYDVNRTPTGTSIPRGSRPLRAGEYQMYVTAIVQDATGRFLITQRSPEKNWGAGWWEFTGGGVPAGETADEAVLREVAEEVGLDTRAAHAELVHTYRNDDPQHGDNYFMNIYRVRLDFTETDVVLQEEEAVACRLATWEDIAALNEKGIFLHFARIAAALEELQNAQ